MELKTTVGGLTERKRSNKMNEELLTDRNILTYEYFTDRLLDYKPEEVFLFFSHDNGYAVERVYFDNLYKRTEEIGDSNIIEVSKIAIGLTRFAEDYLYELVNSEDNDIDIAYLDCLNGKRKEFKREE